MSDKSSENEHNELIPAELIQNRIYIIRGQKVMLDSDLAELYDVPTYRLNEQVKRNIKRFPEDFMFQLSNDEVSALRSQFAILKKSSRGQHSKYNPHAFSEQGLAMLSGVLNSDRAIHVNIAIMRAFVRMRKILSSNEELRLKIEELEKKYEEKNAIDKKHDLKYNDLYSLITKYISVPKEQIDKKYKIGF